MLTKNLEIALGRRLIGDLATMQARRALAVASYQLTHVLLRGWLWSAAAAVSCFAFIELSGDPNGLWLGLLGAFLPFLILAIAAVLAFAVGLLLHPTRPSANRSK